MMGFLIDDLSQSQLLSDVLRTTKNSHEAVLFIRRVEPAWDPVPVGVFSWADAWGFKFPLVATNLDSAFQLIRFPATPRRIFYVNDLEWLRHHLWNGPPPYHALAEIYRSPKLELVCRSEDHSATVAAAWNVTRPRVVSLCDAESLVTMSGSRSDPGSEASNE